LLKLKTGEIALQKQKGLGGESLKRGRKDFSGDIMTK